MKTSKILRKVQLTGGATLIVSLPKEWVKTVNLKPGDYVEIIPQPDNSLKITLAKETEKRLETSFKVHENMSSTAAVREFVSRYILGFNKIKVYLSGRTRKQRNAIKEYMARSLIGVEVVEETESSMIVQCLAGHSELPLKTALRREATTTYYMINDVLKNIKEPDLEALYDIIRRDDEVDKFYLYIMRQMNLVASGIILPQDVGINSVGEAVEYVMLSKAIERVADHAAQIATVLAGLVEENVLINEEIVNAIYDFGSNALELFISSIKALFKQDTITAHDVIDKSVEVKDLEDEVLKLILSTESVVARKALALRTILESFKRIAYYSMDISELVISLTIKSPKPKQLPVSAK